MIGHQSSMTGDDWLSDRERKNQAKAEAARKKAGLACAKKLEAAAEALQEFLRACNECGDASRERGQDDGRRILISSIYEYSTYLNSVYDKGQ